MANAQNTQFGQFAGQLVASGIDTSMPLVALEQAVDQTTYSNLSTINSLIPKIKDIFIRETRIFASPLDPYVTRYDSRYGAGIEQASFMVGAYNEKRDGTCVPMGTPSMASQLDLVNFGYSVDVDVKDTEIDKAVLDEGQAGAYFAEKMKTPLRTISSLRYRSYIQLLSDIVDGQRSISSKDASNGWAAKSGAASVTYAPEIVGYAGKVDKIDTVLPMVEPGVKYTVASPIEALNICNQLKAAAADFRFETDIYNKLGLHTFSTGVPLLIAERKVLDAFDNIFAEFNANGGSNGYYGYAGFPTKSAREYLREFCELVEIDSFASLPDNTGASYEFKTAGYGVHFVLLDRDALVEVVKWANVEGQRCAKKRLTGYNFAGEMVLSVWRGANAYAIIGRLAGELTLSGSNYTVTAGGESAASGDDIAPGTLIVATPGSGYTISAATLNGESIAVGADGKVTFPMPQGDAVLAITTAS